MQFISSFFDASCVLLLFSSVLQQIFVQCLSNHNITNTQVGEPWPSATPNSSGKLRRQYSHTPNTNTLLAIIYYSCHLILTHFVEVIIRKISPHIIPFLFHFTNIISINTLTLFPLHPNTKECVSIFINGVFDNIAYANPSPSCTLYNHYRICQGNTRWMFLIIYNSTAPSFISWVRKCRHKIYINIIHHNHT